MSSSEPPPDSDAPPADLRPFTFAKFMVDNIESWRDHDTFENILALRDGPFVSFGTVRWFEEGGRRFLRMVEAPDSRFVDVEVKPDGMMGEIRPVPPLEAIREARARGWTRGLKG